jgi:hypothetical protein
MVKRSTRWTMSYEKRREQKIHPELAEVLLAEIGNTK